MKLFNTWTTPRFTKWDIIVILVSLFPLAIIRAIAYITSDGGADVLYLVEKTMELKYWGYLVALSLFVLAVGIFLRNHVVIWVGHSLSALVHFVLIVGVLLGYLTEGNTFQMFTYVSFLLTPFVLHLIFSIRMGSSPVELDSSVPVEMVAGEDGQ